MNDLTRMRRRRGDQGVSGRLLVMMDEHYRLISFGWLFVVSVFVALALVRQGDQNDRIKRQSEEAATVAKQACERTRLIAPPLADGLERKRVLTGEPLRIFRSTIPESCSR